ncbi:MAG: hypothetical protein CME70_22790 [Halobacteriovorax sp.]|nr:hypothetical protein [Halobacteriovorax sp.]|tara:strand:+ start:20993 stop:21754 length:762 start_codon:yes stop_codon:yes gene_type:complete
MFLADFKGAKEESFPYDRSMKLLIALIVSFTIYPAFSQGLVSPITEEMARVFSKKDFKTLRNRGFVVKKKNINKSAWPELTIYFSVKASPLETLALFIAYEHQKNYVPGLIKSDVIKQVSPVEIHTAYEMEMPWPLSNSKYIHATVLKKNKFDIFRVDWKMIESNSADIVKGFAEFYPQDDKTIFKYRSFINPKSFLAGLFKKTMIKDVKKSLAAIRNEAERVKGTPQGKEFIKLIELAMSGKYAYPNGRPAK